MLFPEDFRSKTQNNPPEWEMDCSEKHIPLSPCLILTIINESNGGMIFVVLRVHGDNQGVKSREALYSSSNTQAHLRPKRPCRSEERVDPDPAYGRPPLSTRMLLYNAHCSIQNQVPLSHLVVVEVLNRRSR